MSRIGDKLIKIPSGVTVVTSKSLVEATGPKGKLEVQIPRYIDVAVIEDNIQVTRKSDTKPVKSLHGLIRSLISNIITGVSEGFIKKLIFHGVGYKASVDGSNLNLSVGYSHPVNINAPEGIVFKVVKNTISVEGIDKQLVGQVSANIRAVRKPEPYKGKGIRYEDEQIIRKAGKAAKASEGSAK